MEMKYRPRWYCGFCGKSGGSKWHMTEHEKHCTMNPNRICGMCVYAGNEQPDINDLIALFPNIEPYRIYDEFGETVSEECLKLLGSAFEKLKETVPDGCPACILAALRQAGLNSIMVGGWSFKQACKDFLNG